MKIRTAREIWDSRNPVHEFSNGEDLFYKTMEMCMEEYRLQYHASPVMSASDMTARDYFDGEGSPLTLSKICSDEEKEFLLKHIELYASGKVHQSKQPVMSAEEIENSLMRYGSDEPGEYKAWRLGIIDGLSARQKSIPMSAEQVDWESFRDKFFKQCTHNDSMDGCMINTNIEPSALFEWFKHNLPVFTTPSVKADGWVSVEDGLPKEDDEVLGYTVGNYTCICYRVESKRFYKVDGSKAVITHWQPLPASPKQQL